MSSSIVVLLLVLNALFWGLASHSQHCNLASVFGITNCPPHYIHLLMGLVFYLTAVYIEHRAYVNSLF